MTNASYMGLAPSLFEDVEAKTASYTLVPDDINVMFTTRGAGGAITFTLPPTAELTAGWNASFFNVADQDIIVAANTADTMVTFNDAAADSVAFSTSGEQIGGGIRVVWDGTGWLTFVFLGAETQTPTIAT
jgi:hypothetical protein